VAAGSQQSLAGREFPYSSLQRVVEQAVDEYYNAGALYLTDAITTGVLEAGSRALQQMQAFVAGLATVTEGSREQLREVHFQLGAEAQQATLLAYRVARAAGRMSGPYRLSARDAGGRLERAIASREFFRATYDGIGFGNEELLDATARQWHRLNYGAGEAAGDGSRVFSIHFGSAVSASLGLADTPSPGFMLPKGFWRSPSGKFAESGGRGDYFYPNRRGPGPTPTKGIRAWHFFDAGIESIANNLGPAYDGLFRDWYASAQRGLGPLSRVETITVPPPRTPRFKVT
jgi:hypothetical protein